MYSLNTVGKIIKFSKKKSQNLSEKTEVENFKDVSILSTSRGGCYTLRLSVPHAQCIYAYALI